MGQHARNQGTAWGQPAGGRPKPGAAAAHWPASPSSPAILAGRSVIGHRNAGEEVSLLENLEI